MAEDTHQRRPGPGDGASVDLAGLIALRQEAQRLHLAPRGKVLATRSGGHLSRFRGRGMEFDESRVYQPGDDPRYMDWRVTARTGQPHVKLFREERERPVWLVVDLGESMRFGSRVAFKSVTAARAAAVLAWAAVEQGDRVGGRVFDAHCSCTRIPASGERAVLPLLGALAGKAGAAPAGGHPGMDAAARELPALVRPGSLVVLISDFAGIGADAEGWLGRLARTSEVLLLFVYDPLEAEPPPPDLYPAGDGRVRGVLDTSAAELCDAWRARHVRRLETLERLARRYRLHLLALATDQPLGATLAKGLQPGWRPPWGGG
jgi:uncharacterized protein (DUF58 family)